MTDIAQDVMRGCGTRRVAAKAMFSAGDALINLRKRIGADHSITVVIRSKSDGGACCIASTDDLKAVETAVGNLAKEPGFPISEG
jgi:hypothetical protein